MQVDGRYPHWVDSYADTAERFSLIYYQTEGATVPRGSAFFGLPRPGEEEEKGEGIGGLTVHGDDSSGKGGTASFNLNLPKKRVKMTDLGGKGRPTQTSANSI